MTASTAVLPYKCERCSFHCRTAQGLKVHRFRMHNLRVPAMNHAATNGRTPVSFATERMPATPEPTLPKPKVNVIELAEDDEKPIANMGTGDITNLFKCIRIVKDAAAQVGGMNRLLEIAKEIDSNGI